MIDPANFSLGEATAALLATEREVFVWPGRAHGLSLAEDLVVATEPMQRLRRLRQMGLAYHALPLCEHTRFSHSLGTAYWAMRMLNALAPEEREKLTAVEAHLPEGLSLALVVRLFALVHDIALLPLGHTLRFQLRLFDGHGAFDGAMRDCLERVVEGCRRQIPAVSRGPAVFRSLCAHLDLAAAVSRVPRLVAGASAPSLTETLPPEEIVAALPALTFVYDLVHGVYAADIIDVCVRDMAALGRSWEMPEALLAAGAVFTCGPRDEGWPQKTRSNGHALSAIRRYGVSAVADGRTGTAVLTDLLHVHRTRFDVAEKGFYARRKCAADAMLDKAIRRLQAAAPDFAAAVDPSTLLRLGDDALLDSLATLEQRSLPGGPALVNAIREGRLHEEAFSADAVADPGVADHCDALQTAAARTAMEARIAAAAPDLDPADVIVAALPEHMQGKPADTLVGWHGGRVVPFDRLAAELGFPPSADDLPEAYRRLRRLSVYLPARHPSAARVAAACRSLFAAAREGGRLRSGGLAGHG